VKDLEHLERALVEHELIGLTDRELAPRIGRRVVERRVISSRKSPGIPICAAGCVITTGITP
jgi:hypothetical protein